MGSWSHKKKKKHIEGVLFTSGDFGCLFCLVAFWEMFGRWSDRDDGVMFFARPLKVRGLLGIMGSWVEFSVWSVAANEREKGLVRFFFLCTTSGRPYIFVLVFLSFSFFYYSFLFGQIPERDGHIWWFLDEQRCWVVSFWEADLLSSSQTIGVLGGWLWHDLSCGLVFGIKGPSCLVLQWVNYGCGYC